MAVRKAVVYRELANVINNGNLPNHKRFYLVEPEPGKHQVLELLENRVVRFIDPEAVVKEVLKFTIAEGAFEDMTYRDGVECVKYWASITKPIKMPKYLGEDCEAGFCFQRLPFNYLDEPGETLVIDEFLNRCTNRDAIRQFIGSLTVENSSTYQYLWLYGSGGEGKGSFGRALMNIFGSGAVTMAVPRSDGQKQFLAYSLQGKRLCVFPECSNFAFPNDPLFKQLTGGDHIWFEQKGKMGYSGTLNCKFIFFSNEQAGVHGTDANTRRLIYSEISKPTIKYAAAAYDALVANEIASFIIKCRNYYLEKCPNNEDIEINDEKTRELLDFNEENFEILTNTWLEIGANFTATPGQMQEIKKEEKMSNTEYRQWVAYLKAKFGIEIHFIKKDGKSYREWLGIRRKPRDWITGKPTLVKN